MSTDHQLTQLGNEKFNVPAIARFLDAEAKAAYGGSERTQIELVARLVRAQQAEIERGQRALTETHDAWTAETTKRQSVELELDAALMQLQGLKEESERLTAEAIRYRWLRSHLAGTIVQRFNPQEMDWRPEKMDALVDSRLHLVPPLDVGASEPLTPVFECIHCKKKFLTLEVGLDHEEHCPPRGAGTRPVPHNEGKS